MFMENKERSENGTGKAPKNTKKYIVYMDSGLKGLRIKSVLKLERIRGI